MKHTQRPQVLFIVNEVAHYREFKKILVSEKIQSSIDYVLLFDRDGYDVGDLFVREIKDCQKSGLKYAVLPHSRSRQITIPFFSFLSQVFNQFYFYKTKLRDLRTFLKVHQITSIVLGEENILMDTFLYKKAFGKGLVLVYPYTIPNPKEMAGGAAWSISKDKISGQMLRFFGWRFSKQFDQTVFLLIRPYKIFAMLLLGYLPANPWVLNSDTADFICVESQKMADLYVQLGVKKARLKTIGTFNDDILAGILEKKGAVKEAFQRKYNLPNKPIILVGFPPSQFPLKSAEHANYNELIAAWSNSLKPFLSDYTIVITKHPRTSQSFDSMSYLGFTVVEDPTLDLISIAHLYVACASATIRWALAAGVPVINYDTYRYEYGDYDKALGVSTVSSEDDFKKELNRILTDSTYYSEVLQKLSQSSNQWGLLDGKAAKRFIKLLSEIKKPASL